MGLTHSNLFLSFFKDWVSPINTSKINDLIDGYHPSFQKNLKMGERL